MRFTPTTIQGAVIVEADPREDERGFFARLHCPVEFAAAGISFTPLQASLSRNTAALTLRGMHYTTEPEAKLVRCVRGRMLDVLFDIRRDSPTWRQSFAVELDPEGARGLFIPAGVAHGFLTLEPGTDVLYQIDRIYRPRLRRRPALERPRLRTSLASCPRRHRRTRPHLARLRDVTRTAQKRRPHRRGLSASGIQRLNHAQLCSPDDTGSQIAR